MAHDYERPPKRRKLSNEDVGTPRSIGSANNLHNLLKFKQSTDPAVRNSLIAFKDHLAAITRLESTAEQSRQFQYLKEYCQWQKATAEEQLDFYDLLSTWSFAVENNADGVISAATSALAQFLKIIGGSLELRQFGLALIDSLLRRDQAKLFEKSLAAPKSRPHLASPCLRLLTEILSFDAGTRAHEFWYRRDLFLQRLEVCLNPPESIGDAEDRKKPSVRRMALRLVISMLKYLDASAKTDLLFQGRALHACLKSLSQDGDDIVVDLLSAVQKSLVNDNTTPRNALVRFFNSTHLECLLELYSFELDEDEEAKDKIRAVTHDLLLQLCTTEKGIILPQTGWYPLSSTRVDLAKMQDDYIDLGMDSPFYFDDYKEKIPITNTTLSTFSQKLRPYNDDLQSSLLLRMFDAVPELLADYFSRRRQMLPANSDDAQWRAQFALILSIVDLGVPKDLGHSAQPQEPPPVTIVIESIVPRPVDRTYMVKLLQSEDPILQISAATLIARCLNKLEKAELLLGQKAATNTYLWQQASEKLSELVQARLPSIRDLNTALRKSKEGVQSAFLECLLAYHEVLPHSISSTDFDIGPLMLALCQSITDTEENTESMLAQLAICVQIAETSSSTRWLHKSDNDTLSPVSQILQTCLELEASQPRGNILNSLRSIVLHKGILDQASLSFAALCTSFNSDKEFSPGPELFNFFDNCVVRASSKPVKYVDSVEQASREVSDRKLLSLFVGTIPEQWTIFLKRYESDKKVVKTVAMWIARLFSLLDEAGENYRIMLHFQQEMLKAAQGKTREYLQEALDKVRKKPVTIDEQYKVDEASQIQPQSHIQVIDKQAVAREDLDSVCNQFTPVPESLHGLDRWPAGFDIELEITTKRLQRLILCLSSPDDEIRLQANQIVQQLASTPENNSDYDGKEQINLILGELTETLKQSDLSQPLPAVIPLSANALLETAVRPQHIMFPKINKFLLRRPSWTAKGIIHYWIEHILRRETDGDEEDQWNKEREWLLNILVSGLRVQLDVDLYREHNVWEHLLSLYASPCLSLGNRKLILALLWQCAGMEKGADMLWTRFGVYSWLLIVKDSDEALKDRIDVLLQKLREESDRPMIEEWKIACKATKMAEDGGDEVMVNGFH